VRAGQIISQVLDLAESLPARRRGPLEYPSLRGLPGSLSDAHGR
jgi:hypothetical protein